MTNDKQNEFLLDMAKVLEKHRVAICSRNTGEYSKVFFQRIDSKPFKQINIDTTRLHVSAYDLRCMTGMGTQEANNMYHAYKTE